jgi:hypothetical protein
MKSYTVVLDLETLGTRPGCAVIEMGAVVLEEPWRCFQCRPSVASNVACGLKIEVETVAWWMDQAPGAALAGLKSCPMCALPEALAGFAGWMRELGERPRIVGNGPTFDLSILAAAYAACGMARPWDFRDERCLRTALDPAFTGIVPPERGETAHRALADALAEASQLAKVREVLLKQQIEGKS